MCCVEEGDKGSFCAGSERAKLAESSQDWIAAGGNHGAVKRSATIVVPQVGIEERFVPKTAPMLVGLYSHRKN